MKRVYTPNQIAAKLSTIYTMAEIVDCAKAQGITIAARDLTAFLDERERHRDRIFADQPETAAFLHAMTAGQFALTSGGDWIRQGSPKVIQQQPALPPYQRTEGYVPGTPAAGGILVPEGQPSLWLEKMGKDGLQSAVKRSA